MSRELVLHSKMRLDVYLASVKMIASETAASL